MKQLLKDAWSYAKQLTIVAFIKDAIKGGKEVFKEIGERLDEIFFWAFIFSPLGISLYFFGPQYIMPTLIYMCIGIFPALFNDNGPVWWSYVVYYFWPVILVGYLLIVKPGRWILEKLGWMKPKYTPEEIEASEYFAEVGRELIKKNKKQ